MKSKKGKKRILVLSLLVISFAGVAVLFVPSVQAAFIRKFSGNKIVRKVYDYFMVSPPAVAVRNFSIPKNYSIHGIDISHHQGSIDWDKVGKSKLNGHPVSFAIIKATEGSNFVDHRFSHNWKSIGSIKRTRGAYHFFRPKSNPESQANNYIKTVKLVQGDLPPIVDVEVTDGQNTKTIRSNLKGLLLILENHYKVKPIIYSSPSFYYNILGDDFNEYPFWVSHFGVRTPAVLKTNWKLWQYTEHGSIEGIRGSIDCNVFCCDSSEFRKILLPF
jgi:lysozyme